MIVYLLLALRNAQGPSTILEIQLSFSYCYDSFGKTDQLRIVDNRVIRDMQETMPKEG
jgi:hypothetical protein